MRIQNVDIPQAAIDAGRAAMVTGFRAADVQGAVASTLRTLADDQAFDYGGKNKDEIDMRVADRMIQNARKAGEIVFAKGCWKVVA